MTPTQPRAQAQQTHTPGPWRFRHSSECNRPLGWIDSRTNNSLVELRGTSAEGRKDFEGNARLIAAAPELLAALKTMTDDFVGLAGHTKTTLAGCYQQSVNEARAAIAKAEGRTP